MSGSTVKPELFPSCPDFSAQPLCSARILFCFGIPLLPPSAVLLGIAFGSQTEFGFFHVTGLILTSVSFACIFSAIIICCWHKHKRRVRLKFRLLDFEKQEEWNKENGTTKTSGKANSLSVNRVARKPGNGILNDSIRGTKKQRKDKTRTNGSKLPPLKEEDRIRGEDPPHGKTHTRSKSDGKGKFSSEKQNPLSLNLCQQHEYDYGQLFGPRRHLRGKRSLLDNDSFIDYDSDSSSQTTTTEKVRRITKAKRKQRFERALKTIPVSSGRESQFTFRQRLLKHMGLQVNVIGTGLNDEFAWPVQESLRRSKSMSDCGDSDRESQTTFSEFSFDIDTPREDKCVRYNRATPVAWRIAKETVRNTSKKTKNSETIVRPILISSSHQKSGVRTAVTKLPHVT